MCLSPNKKGVDVSRRTLTVADASHRSVPVTIFAPRVQHIEGESGQIIAFKGRTDSYQGACKLTAFVEDVTVSPSIAEAHALHAHWAQARPHVTPLLPALNFTPIASLAALAAADAPTDTVDLLVVVVSAEPPVAFVGSTSGKEQRRLSLVVCDASEGGRSCPLTCFAPAEGALPAFAPGVLLAIAGARVDSFQGEPRCTAWVDRCTLDPYVPEASATLKAWWAARVGDDPPPLISSVSRCIPLAEVATACAKGAPTVDVLAVVCGDVADKTFATGEVARVMTLCDYDASALLYVLRGGDGTASASYGDGAVLHVAGAELGQAADGRYTLVATAANVRAFLVP